jgi:hypothetical protein
LGNSKDFEKISKKIHFSTSCLTFIPTPPRPKPMLPGCSAHALSISQLRSHLLLHYHTHPEKSFFSLVNRAVQIKGTTPLTWKSTEKIASPRFDQVILIRLP